jgi:O-antigen/teichoic acid export membrane protein
MPPRKRSPRSARELTVTRGSPERPAAVASPAEAVRRLFGRGSVYTLVLAIQMLTGLIAVPLLTRLLTPSSYGRVVAAIVVYTVLSIIGAAGLPDAASRTFFAESDGPRHARRLITAATCFALLLSLLADLTGPLWAPLFGLNYGGVLRLAVWAGAGGAVMLGAQSLLRVADRVWAFLAVALLAAVGGQALGLTLTALSHSATAYMAGIAAGAALAAAAGLTATGCLRSGMAGLGELRKGLGLGLPIVPHSLAVSMLASADRVVIVAALGLAAAGRYQVAYAIGSVGVALVVALNMAWLPLLLGASKESRWEILTATSRVVHLLAASVASLLALVAPLALLIAAPASYGRESLVPVAAIVAFSALPYATCGTYFQVVFVSGRTRIMAIAAPLAAAINIGLNVLLLPVIGLTGAAIATVVAYAVLPGVVALTARRIVSLPGASRDALSAWLLAAPFVAAGALLPSGAVGVTARIAAAIVAVAGTVRLLRSATRRSPAVVTVSAAEPPSREEEDTIEAASTLHATVHAGP